MFSLAMRQVQRTIDVERYVDIFIQVSLRENLLLQREIVKNLDIRFTWTKNTRTISSPSIHRRNVT